LTGKEGEDRVPERKTMGERAKGGNGGTKPLTSENGWSVKTRECLRWKVGDFPGP